MNSSATSRRGLLPWSLGPRGAFTSWIAITAEIRADFPILPFAEFFGKLEEKGWLHRYDKFGRGPHDPEHLPENVRCLADDPYRSLAWMLRDAGGYEKSAEPGPVSPRNPRCGV